MEFETFKQSIRGNILTNTSKEYDDARKVFNKLIDKHPKLIVQARGVSDILTSIAFCKENNLEISVKAGGHGVAGKAVCNDGLVLDLSLMRSVVINPFERVASVEAGALWYDLDCEAAKFGLATTGGIYPDTGVGGLTLGGGVGWLMGKYGLACDNLSSIDMVTANGEFVQASQENNADLFWAIRGGGGNFGIVTRFEFKLHPVKNVLAGSVIFPFQHASQVLALYRELAETASDELTLDLVLGYSKEEQPYIAIDCCYCGNTEIEFKELDMILEKGLHTDNSIRQRSYYDWQWNFYDPSRRELRSYWKSAFVPEINSSLIDIIIGNFLNSPSKKTILSFDHVHGAVHRVPTNETAFSQRGMTHLFLINTSWSEIEDDELNIQWTKSFFDELQNYVAQGSYTNYVGAEGESQMKHSFGPKTYTKLVNIKRKYDPHNLFRPNQNILPVNDVVI